MATSEPQAQIIEWALGELSKSPAMQSFLAVVIVLLMAFPLIRGALKAVKPVAPPPPTPIIQETPWLITTLTGIQIRVDQMHEKQDNLRVSIDGVRAGQSEILRRQESIAAGLAALTKLLRKCQGRSG